MSMLMGLRELKRMGVSDCIIEGELAVVIGWGQEKKCNSWQLCNLVYEAHEISSDLGRSFTHPSGAKFSC